MKLNLRFKTLIQELKNRGIVNTQKELGQMLGYDNESSFSQIINEKVEIPKNFGKRISAIVPDLNIEWLLTGEGSMLKSSTETPAESVPQIAEYLLVPMYNLDARGGFGTNDNVDVAEYIVDRIPFKDAHSNDICVPICGNSMTPTFSPGSIVLLCPVEYWKEFLELGQVYVIVLKDGRRIIKELRASEEDKKANYLCVSHNKDYDPVELPKEMIHSVFLVKATYTKNTL